MTGEFSFENSVGSTGEREPKMWECPKCRESVEDDFDVCYDELVERLTLFLEEKPLLEAER